MASADRLVIGTRGSPLALAQVELTRRALLQADPGFDLGRVETLVIRTTGDRVTDRPLADIGGKGLFTKEIDQALLEGAIDVGVHSMKDVPTWLPPGIVIAAILERADPRDALVTAAGLDLDDLPAGSRVGTVSVRRQSQLLARRPDLTVVPLRGNVQTRLSRCADGSLEAVLLAMAGLVRLGLADRPLRALDPAVMLPAAAQGAVGLLCREGDGRMLALLATIDHRPSHLAVTTERAMLDALDGSCRTPIGAHAVLDGGGIHLQGLVAAPDGHRLARAQARGGEAEAAALGRDLGQVLRGQSDPAWFAP